MSKNRRDFFRRIGSVGAGLVVGAQTSQTQENPHVHHRHGAQTAVPAKRSRAATASGAALPVEAPDVSRLPWKLVDSAKEFHLVAEPVRTEFVPGRVVDAWG